MTVDPAAHLAVPWSGTLAVPLNTRFSGHVSGS